jgi:protein TonB
MHARPTERRFTETRRSSTGLAITIAVHAGIAALALAGLGVVTAPTRPPPPITLIDIALPPTATPPAAEPKFVEQPIRIDVARPVIDITRYPTDTGEPAVVTGTPGTDTGDPTLAIDPPVQPLGPSVGARFDPRYAAAAQPPYPAAARRLGEEGSVVVHVRIGRDGKVLTSTLAQSSGSPRLDAAALAHALAHWRFTPALKDGVAVEESRDITVRFQLALAG